MFNPYSDLPFYLVIERYPRAHWFRDVVLSQDHNNMVVYDSHNKATDRVFSRFAGRNWYAWFLSKCLNFGRN